MQRRKALITGGAGKLGSQITRFLCDSGYDVCITYNTSGEKLKYLRNYFHKKRQEFLAIKVDLSDEKSEEKVIDYYKKNWKNLDLLINNAGIFPKHKYNEITLEKWEEVFNINLKSVFFLSQKAAAIMKSGGLIINIASLGAFEIWKDRLLYNVSKSAQTTLTKALASALAPEIRVNSIAPGTIDIPGDLDKFSHYPEDKLPLKKYVSLKDIFETITFFINCKSLTGIIIPLDNGKLLKQ